MSDTPRLTIGMPLYNNASTIARALESLLAQSFMDFTIIASDDGSTDDTVRMVADFARADSRVVLVQQPHNLNYGNFRFVLQQATTPFFMFAAGDDYWDSRFVAACIEALDAHPEACLVAPRVQFFGKPTELVPGSGTYPLTARLTDNLARYLRGPLDNSRMYGIFRTDAAQRAFPSTDHFAFDWTFSAATLRDGHHRELPDVLMHRDVTPSDRYVEYVRRDNQSLAGRLFPLLPMTRSLLFEKRIPITRRVVRALARANLEYHFSYAKRHHPLYTRVFGPLLSRVIPYL